MSDARAIVDIYSPIVLDTTISFETTPSTETEMEERIASTLVDWPWIVCEEAGVLIGYAYATKFRVRAAYRFTAEVSAYVRAGERGRGVGRELYRVLLDLLRIQGAHTAIAVIALPNAESVAVHERVGFRRVGTMHGVGRKFGAWIDTGYWQIALVADQPRADAPLSIERASQLPAWKDALLAR